MMWLTLLAKHWPKILLALIVGAFVWWIVDMRSDLAQLRTANESLSVRLSAEEVARRRDVASLTALSTGLAAVAVETKKDAAVVTETVKDANAPLSPQLSSLLDQLREQAAGKPANPAK
jgi:hypothetical protein